MKKFYIADRYNEDNPQRYAVYFDFENSRFADIVGFTHLEETGGNPVTDIDDDAATLDELKALATTEIMDTDEDDEEYILGWCEAWGLIPHREEEDEG